MAAKEVEFGTSTFEFIAKTHPLIFLRQLEKLADVLMLDAECVEQHRSYNRAEGYSFNVDGAAVWKRRRTDGQEFAELGWAAVGADDAISGDDDDDIDIPNAPKRPQNGYFIYMNANRARIKEENEGCAFGDVGKIASKEFKALAADELSVWTEKVAADKERYEKELIIYEKEMKKYVVPNGGNLAPKRPQNGYFIYMNANRARIKEENEGCAFGDVGKIASKEFKALAADDLSVWTEKVAADKERYEKEMIIYEKEMKNVTLVPVEFDNSDDNKATKKIFYRHWGFEYCEGVWFTVLRALIAMPKEILFMNESSCTKVGEIFDCFLSLFEVRLLLYNNAMEQELKGLGEMLVILMVQRWKKVDEEKFVEWARMPWGIGGNRKKLHVLKQLLHIVVIDDADSDAAMSDDNAE